MRGNATDLYGNQRIGLEAKGQLSREEFGIPYDEAVAGLAVVADTVTLTLDIEAIKQT